MPAKLFRLRIATAGATAVDLNVDVTITSSQLASVPTIPGPIARPLDGKTEAQPWQAEMRSSAIHGDIADANGRLDLGGRLCDWSESTDDGVSYTVLWTGRLTGLSSPDPATFRATMEDERWLERRSTIFTEGNTTQIFPPGPNSAFLASGVVGKPGGTATMRVAKVDNPDVLRLFFVNPGPISEDVVAFIRQDKKPDASGALDRGNFTHLRLNTDGTDREIVSLADSRSTTDVTASSAMRKADPEVPDVWVYWPSHGQTEGTDLADGSGNTMECYLHAMSAAPTKGLPLHIGGTTGIEAATLAANIYNGDYGARDESGNPVTVRADLSALSGGRVWFRITKPANMARWLEENIYKPLLWCPFTNADGKVVPRSVALPRDIDYTTLTTLNGTNVLEPHPDWDSTTRDAITSVSPELVTYEPDPDAGDRVQEMVIPLEPRDHDNISRLGRRSVTRRMPFGMGLKVYEREVFDRVGDGLLRIPAIRVRDSVTEVPGDLVEIDHDSLKLPNPNTNDRTGSTIWQVLKRDRLPGTGHTLELEYAGPHLQKLAAPTVAAAQNTADPQTSVDATISDLLSGEGYILEVDRGSGYQFETAGTTNETVVVGPGSANGGCPSGTPIGVRAVRTKKGRIRSAYATASVTTASITAPSTFTGTVSGTTIAGEWTNGSSEYDVMPTLDGVDVLSEPLEAGSDTFVWQGLSASTAYTLGVKHIDAYGGASALTTLSKTTGAAGTLTAPSGLGVVQGRDSASSALPFILFGKDTGIEVAWDNAGEGADVEWQVSTDSGFTTTLREGTVENTGQRVGRAVVLTGLRKDPLYVRVRHTGDGFTDSAWSATVSTYATVLKDTGGPRKTELLANTDAGAVAKADDLDGVPDGTTYGRPVLTALTGGEVDLGKTGVINKLASNIAYADATAVENLKPAEAGAEVNPPKLKGVSLLVNDDGVNDNYTLSWGYTDAVDGTYTVDAEFYRNGTLEQTVTGTVATDGTVSVSDASGDGIADDHHAIAWLKGSGGGNEDTVETFTIKSTV